MLLSPLQIVKVISEITFHHIKLKILHTCLPTHFSATMYTEMCIWFSECQAWLSSYGKDLGGGGRGHTRILWHVEMQCQVEIMTNWLLYITSARWKFLVTGRDAEHSHHSYILLYTIQKLGPGMQSVKQICCNKKYSHTSHVCPLWSENNWKVRKWSFMRNFSIWFGILTTEEKVGHFLENKHLFQAKFCNNIHAA